MPGSILSETEGSYIVDDGTGNITAVPKGTIDPKAYGYTPTTPAAPTPTQDNAPAPAPVAPPTSGPVGFMPAQPGQGTGIGSVMPTPVIAPTPQQVQSFGPPPTPAPPPKPLTQGQHGMGLEEVGASEGMAGIRDQQQGALAEGTAKAAQSDATARAMAKTNDDILAQQKAQAAQQQADHARYQQYQTDAKNALNAADNYQVDRNRLYNNMGTAKKVGVYLMAALSGLGDALQHKSGPNAVLGMLDGAIAQDVNAQLDERERLGKKAQHAQTTMDRFVDASKDRQQAFNAKMAQMKENAARDIERIAAQYGSPEAMARAAQTAGALRAQAGDHIEKAGERMYQQDFQERQMQAQDKRAAQANAIAGGHLALAQKQFTLAQKTEEDRAANEAAALALKAQGKDPETVKLVMEQGVGGLKNDDGTPFVAGDKERATKLIDQKAGVDSLNEIANELVNMKKASGGANNYTSSARYEEIRSKMQALLVATHAGMNIPGFKGPVVEHLEKALEPGGDFTSYIRDNTAGLIATRDSANTLFTNQLRAASGGKFTGSYAPLDTTKFSDPSLNALDKDQEMVMSKATVNTIQGPVSAADNINPAQKAAIQHFVTTASTAPDANDRKLAFERLVYASQNAPDQTIRDYASQKLAEVNGGSVLNTSLNAPEQVSGGTAPYQRQGALSDVDRAKVIATLKAQAESSDPEFAAQAKAMLARMTGGKK